MTSTYRGRFAPSPTGPLHLGSLLTAVGSYLQAKQQKGQWLVRIEDLDPPREIAGAADGILRTLENFGLQWDENISYQSQRLDLYHDALQQLKQQNLIYNCSCSRRTIQAHGAIAGKIGLVYPGTCRQQNIHQNDAIKRLKTSDQTLTFDDLIQDRVTQHLNTDIGDINLQRANGLYAYHIAVVVDDYLQNINEVVRGYDLINCTPIQIYLQQCLNYCQPAYAHLPIIVDAQHVKLSKQTGASSIENERPEQLLIYLLKLLQQQPPESLNDANKHEILSWAVEHWSLQACSMQFIETA